MTIGELAARFGLATSVLRYWEQVGVLAPAARKSGRRLYDADAPLRVAMVLLAKDAGLSLSVVRRLQTTRSAARRRRLLSRKIAELDRRIAESQAAKRMAIEAAACKAPDPVLCPHFRHVLERRLRITH
jgi:DNA-binding transcriptional MerR regulator